MRGETRFSRLSRIMIISLRAVKGAGQFRESHESPGSRHERTSAPAESARRIIKGRTFSCAYVYIRASTYPVLLICARETSDALRYVAVM